ncbi:hypothetical protein HDC93_007409 [Streptomyces sp. AK010]|nr:hypothetical protein [Streptomyces sp. AK010]
MVSEPSLFTHVVEVSVRSDSASTRLPDSRAATRADGMSAACVAVAFFVALKLCAAGADAAAAYALSSSVTVRARDRLPAIQRVFLPAQGRLRLRDAGVRITMIFRPFDFVSCITGVMAL